MTKPIEATDADYSEKMAGASGLMLFYKKICPHCKALKKVVEKFSNAMPDGVIIQINSEENPGAMTELDISRVPTLLIFKNGEIKTRKAGLMNLRQMTALYQSV
jgi:thioredoxin 1